MSLGCAILVFLILALWAGDATRAPTWNSCGCYWCTWQPWSSCTATCGGGYRERDRKVWLYDKPQCQTFEDCASNDEGWQTERCNVICFNGGTFSAHGSYGGYCRCPPGRRGACCEQTVDCGSPSTISNGNVRGATYTYGRTVTYTCDYKYKMTNPAAAVRSCTEHGYWSGSLPVCLYAESCSSNPCQNRATCENLLGDFRCHCAPGWSGSTCEMDVQPPIMTGCPSDRLAFVTNLTRHEEWTAPTFSNPHGFNISVTSNYEESEYEFPWGEFVVQYYAVKPSNGMTAECNFRIAVKPHQCPSLQTPTNGIVACNGWRTDYTNICRIYCLDGYVFPPGVDPESMFVCGATGKWMPGMAFEECIPQDFVNPSLRGATTFSGCQDPSDIADITVTYINNLKSSMFNDLCLSHATECLEQNVIVRCK